MSIDKKRDDDEDEDKEYVWMYIIIIIHVTRFLKYATVVGVCIVRPRP